MPIFDGCPNLTALPSKVGAAFYASDNNRTCRSVSITLNQVENDEGGVDGWNNNPAEGEDAGPLQASLDSSGLNWSLDSNGCKVSGTAPILSCDPGIYCAAG